MAVTGSLETIPLPDVLQWLSFSEKTGRFMLSHAGVEKVVYFQKGRIAAFATSDPKDLLGQILLSTGRITEDDLKALLARQKGGDVRRLGDILVEDGVFERKEMEEIIRRKLMESLYELFLWESGEFTFTTGADPAEDSLPIKAAVKDVILEGMRRKEAWREIRGLLPDDRLKLAVNAGAFPDFTALSHQEMLVLQAAREQRSIGEICLELRGTRLENYALVADLIRKGHYLIDSSSASAIQPPAPPPETAARPVEGRINDLLVETPDPQGDPGTREDGELKDLRAAVPGDAVPRRQVAAADGLSPVEGFVFSRITGDHTVADLAMISPIGERELLKILKTFLDRRWIELSRA